MADDEELEEVSSGLVEGAILTELQNVALDAVVRRGHAALLRSLVAKAEAGTIKHPEMAILRNMLRDNGMMLLLNDGDTIEGKPLLAPPTTKVRALPEPDYDE